MDEETAAATAAKALVSMYGVPDRPVYFNRYGEPISPWEWINRDGANDVLMMDVVGHVVVATIYDGHDSTYEPGDAPLIFSTGVTCTCGELIAYSAHADLSRAYVAHRVLLAIAARDNGYTRKDIWYRIDSRPALTASSR